MEANTLQTVDAHLTTREWDLIWRLRVAPDSPLKDRVIAVASQLVDLAGDPKCAEFQADGAPCAQLDRACETCFHVQEVFDALVRRGLLTPLAPP